MFEKNRKIKISKIEDKMPDIAVDISHVELLSKVLTFHLSDCALLASLKYLACLP